MAAEQPSLPIADPTAFTAARKLTRKRQRFVAELIRTGNATEAAARAYDCATRATAANVGYENVRIPEIRQAVADAWAREGITPDRWAGVLSRKLDAKTLISLGKDDVREVEDHATQLKAVELSARMLGALEPQRRVAHAHAHLHRLQAMSLEELEILASGRKPEGQS